MRKKTYRKLNKLSTVVYDLGIRVTMGGFGGSLPPTAGEIKRYAAAKRFFYGHPNYEEYSKISIAYANAACAHAFNQHWDDGGDTYHRRFWRDAYQRGVDAQEAAWAKRRLQQKNQPQPLEVT